jgi:exodeoxyribonuclease VII large subunit
VAGERRECDVLVVCRGGGSLEDLWAFNDERLARAIAASPIPVVSGVGHETDFTIADFVADVRAATPTAAAAIASPDREALLETIEALRRRLARDARRLVETLAQRVDSASRRLLTPAQRLERGRETLALCLRRLRAAAASQLALRRAHLDARSRALALLDPTRVLARGYAIVRDADGAIRHTSDGLAAGASLDITFSEGGAEASVSRVRGRTPN